MNEISEKQIETAKEIDRLMKQVFGEDYWKPKMGDIALPSRYAFLSGSFALNKNDDYGPRLIIFPKEVINQPPENGQRWTPLLSWADCRALLRKMGWRLAKSSDGLIIKSKWVSLRFEKFGEPWRKNITRDAESDLEAIMLVLLGALKRAVKLARQSEGGGGEQARPGG